MNELIALTEAEVAAATTANAEVRRLAERVKAAAMALSTALQRFRKAADRVLGAKHPDYRSLRIRERRTTEPTEAESPITEPMKAPSLRPVPSAALGNA